MYEHVCFSVATSSHRSEFSLVLGFFRFRGEPSFVCALLYVSGVPATARPHQTMPRWTRSTTLSHRVCRRSEAAPLSGSWLHARPPDRTGTDHENLPFLQTPIRHSSHTVLSPLLRKKVLSRWCNKQRNCSDTYLIGYRSFGHRLTAVVVVLARLRALPPRVPG